MAAQPSGILDCGHTHFQGLTAFLDLAGHGVAAGGLHAAVSKIVGQTDDILFLLIEAAGEKVAQVVGEYLAFFHPGAAAEGLHGAPDIAPVHGSAGSGYKYTAAGAVFLPAIVLQQLHQGGGQEDMAYFPLGIDAYGLLAQGFHGDGGELADPDPGAADGLDDAGEAAVRFPVSLTHQAFVVLPGQLPGLIQEELALDSWQTDAAFLSSYIFKVAVESYQHGAGTGILVAGQQIVPVAGHSVVVQLVVLDEGQEFADVAYVLADSAGFHVAGFQIDPVVFQNSSWTFFSHNGISFSYVAGTQVTV